MLELKKKSVMFTGIQPTGSLTLGNYCGTMCSWGNLQKYYQCFFCVADLHALMSTGKKRAKYHSSKKILDMVALYLSCGVDPENNVIFVQSQIHTHSQLYWLLSNFCYFGELSRMTQFKQKSKHSQVDINLSLFCYPVLMAADILLYQTSYVSVGLDQKQHLELAQNIARRFNKLYGGIFTIPRVLINPTGFRVMALQDPQKKMSKSDANVNNTIFLLDDINIVRSKLKRSLTDSDFPAQVIYDPQRKPGVSNLLSIFSSLAEKTISQIELEFKDHQYSSFKQQLSDLVCDRISMIQKLYFSFRKDEDYLIDILKFGKKKAIHYSTENLYKVFKALDL
ncbi:tryptophan--tRNA ligase [Buchnera aphidicola]|uniref:tryptophan--tRNA ligase n=1 Tax=Buchnera aphidicola TaxID=9 RepID=UPI00094C5DE5|nr:tryptophan--tRNA ligase [Buchnera aphidicola]